MKLLTATEIKKEKRVSDVATQRRMQDMQRKEIEISQALNTIKVTYGKQEKFYKEETLKIEVLFSERKANLSEEVSALEERRRASIAPLNDRRQELLDSRVKLEADQNELLLREQCIEEKEALIMKNTEQLVDRIDKYKDTQEKLDKREQGIREAEEIIEKTALSLSNSWVEFYKKTEEANADLRVRELTVQTETKALDSIREEQERITKELSEERRGIKDGYDTLAKAQKEILG